MTASQATGARVRGLSPENGVKALFFSYFGLVGAFSPYLSLYFAAVGLSITQIGVLMAMPQVVRIFGPPFWGWLADALDRR
ncbi:MAG TPA: MFS transporter, partial [Quisquiliibacterium sp.]|nr:MFS transporter [Quisquiliibacterium sp.]